MSLITMASYGYRKLEALPAGTNVNAPDRLVASLLQGGEYEAVPGNWVRKRTRGRNVPMLDAIRLVDVIDKATPLDNARMGFVDDYLRTVYAAPAPVEFEADTAGLSQVVRELRTEQNRCLALGRLVNAVLFAPKRRLKAFLQQEVIPVLFDLYPDGRLVVLQYDERHDTSAAVARVLYAMGLVPGTDLQRNNVGVPAMQGALQDSLPVTGPVFLSILSHLFYPYVQALRFGQPGLDFLFLFEPSEQYQLPIYPRDWLAIPQFTASFAKEPVDLGRIVTEVNGSAAQRAGHRRFLHSTTFSPDDRLTLLKWYIGRVNRLLYELTDVCNFLQDPTDKNSPIDPVAAFEHNLTVQRLMRSTLLALTTSEPTAALNFTFEVAYLYDEPRQRFTGCKSTEFVKTLFDTGAAPAFLAPHIHAIPGAAGEYLRAHLDDIYRTIEGRIIDSVWLRSRVEESGVRVRKANLREEELLPRGRFVAELLQATRNAHHGYLSNATNRSRPSRFLFLSDGNLPAELTALPALWWLAYLGDPTFFGWSPLGVNEFDTPIF